MARINIEDSLLKDDRFSELMLKLGSRIMALGVITEAFILAQKHYLTEVNGRLIPLNEWQRKTELHVLIDVGLAEKKEHGIYIKGSESNFKWLLQKQAAGKSSAESKRIKRAMESTDVNGRSTASNGSQPLTLTPSLTLKKENIKKEKSKRVLDSELVFRIEQIYSSLYPRKEGKSAGLKKLANEINFENLSDFETAVKNYSSRVKDQETKFIKHFSSFATCWRDYLTLEQETKKPKYQVLGND